MTPATAGDTARLLKIRRCRSASGEAEGAVRAPLFCRSCIDHAFKEARSSWRTGRRALDQGRESRPACRTPAAATARGFVF